MIKQRTFDTVAEHLLTQNERCVVQSLCRYRGPNGTKCAAGALIPDADYYPGMELKTVKSPIVADVLTSLGHDLDLVHILQRVHDEYDPDQWADILRGVALCHDLCSDRIDRIMCDREAKADEQA